MSTISMAGFMRAASSGTLHTKAPRSARTAKLSALSYRFLQKILDAVELRERGQRRRQALEHKPYSVREGAPFPSQQHRHARGIDDLDVAQVDHTRRRERDVTAFLEQCRRGIHG